MNPFAYLVGTHIQSVTCRDYDWLIEFSDRSIIQIECLWRLLQFEKIVFTSQDYETSSVFASQIDMAGALNSKLVSRTVISVELLTGSLDVTFTFDESISLQIISTSSVYESWQAYTPDDLIVAMGCGEIVIFPKS